MAAFNKKYDGIREFYESGVSTRELADRWGVTISDMYAALRRRGTKFGPAAPRLDPKYDAVIEAYKRGMSTRACAKYFNVSKTAVWVALKRRGLKMRAQARRGIENNLYRGGSNVSVKANQAVGEAIRNGTIIPEPCESCKASQADGLRVVAHHDDYNFPLRIRWLCMKCHHDWHLNHKAVPLKKI